MVREDQRHEIYELIQHIYYIIIWIIYFELDLPAFISSWRDVHNKRKKRFYSRLISCVNYLFNH